MSLMSLVSGMSWSSSAAGLRAAVRLLLLGLFLSTEPASSVGDSPVLPPEPSPLSLLYLLRHLLVVSPYCVSTLLLVSIYSSHQRTGSKWAVSMETSEQGEEYDDIVTEHHF